MSKFYYFIIFYLLVTSLSAQETYYPYSFEGKYGIIDNNGTVILPPTYEEIELFKNQPANTYTRFQQKDEKTGETHYGLISTTGEIVLDPQPSSFVYDGNGGFCWETKNNAAGEPQLHLYAIKTQRVLPEAYSMSKVLGVLGEKRFFVGLVNPSLPEEHIIMDEEGKILFTYPIAFAHTVEAYYTQQECPLFAWNDGSRMFYKDCNGNTTTKEEFDKSHNYPEDIIDYPMEEMDMSGKRVEVATVQAKFPDLDVVDLAPHAYFYRLMIVRKGDKYGVANKKGEVILDYQYDSIEVLGKEDCLITTKDGLKGLLLTSGKEVYQPQFTELHLHTNEKLIQVTSPNGYSGYAQRYKNKVYLPR